MSDMLQKELEIRTLGALYDLANMNGEWVDAAHVASIIQNNISEQRAKMALRTLENSRLVQGQHNAIKGSKYQISVTGYKQVEADQIDRNDTAEQELSEAPASNRIVGFDHNSRDYIEIRRQFSQLREQLESANDIGELTSRKAKVASAEIAALGQTLDADYFRPTELWTRARLTLGWIGREEAGALVGAAALGLLALLATLLGFTLV